MKAVRRLAMVLAVVTAMVVPAAHASAAPRLVRIDTDAAGVTGVGGDARFAGLSTDGRYALFTAATNDAMVPAPHRTSTRQGFYVLRKDTRYGGVTLVSVTPAGRPLLVGWNSRTMRRDGAAYAYATDPYSGTAVVLYYRDPASGVREIATLPSGWGAGDIALSTDGHWLSWHAYNTLSAADVLYRHDLRTGQTTTPLDCADPSTGCYLSTGPVVSDDGAVFALKYRPTPTDPILLAVLDPATGQVRALPEGEEVEDYTISGDGKWIFYSRGFGCPSCGGGRFELKKISTAPGAAPVLLRAWEDSVTWGVSLTSAGYTGELVGYNRQTGVSGKYFAAARGYVHDQVTGIETLMPEPRPDVAYGGPPTVSSDSRLAVFGEQCLWATSCDPTGTYAVPLAELLPGRTWTYPRRVGAW